MTLGWRRTVVAAFVTLGITTSSLAAAPGDWDTFSDTWVATDGLGRSLPTFEEVGGPRPDRTIGIFYFLWHGEHVNGGPYDISRILAQDPDALQKPDSPLWGPLHAPHHWGESLFGYYLTDDAFVLRKHAQMLADAGVDAVLFDVSNQFTYRRWYTPLLRVFTDAQRAGGTPPRVAFLCPFWEPQRVVRELYRDLYAPGRFSNLWFRWDNKPLILADPMLVWSGEGTQGLDNIVPAALRPKHTLGQSFRSDKPFDAVGGRFPTWQTTGSAMTLTLRQTGPGGPVVARRRFENVADNDWLFVELPRAAPPGVYTLEMSGAKGTIGWWTHARDVFPGGQAFADGKPAASPGDRTLRWRTTNARSRTLLDFFTFRAPQPSYFAGPTRPDMWSWLEVFPQHMFHNTRGEREQMSVGVAQNAVGDRLAAMSDPGARGRSFHEGATDTTPGAEARGLNFAEQFERALREDPRFVFITGWNEWIAGRFAGEATPVRFVDQFDQEHSRDIEPMRGGHGDDYYYQMVAFIRRYKGVRPLPPVAPRPITLDGRFDDWQSVTPEFRDTIGDPARRDHPAWNHVATYRNTTGRNDLVAAKVSVDADNVYFYVRTRAALTPFTGAHWMQLFVDSDRNAQTGWLGYDFRITPDPARPNVARISRSVAGAFRWQPVGEALYRAGGREIELAVPRETLGLAALPATIDFKWADNLQQTGDWSDFTLHGDTAPNDRFNYRAKLPATAP